MVTAVVQCSGIFRMCCASCAEVCSSLLQAALVQARTDKSIMSKNMKKTEAILREMVMITLRTELTKIQRTNLETCITIHMHQKESTGQPLLWQACSGGARRCVSCSSGSCCVQLWSGKDRCFAVCAIADCQRRSRPTLHNEAAQLAVCWRRLRCSGAAGCWALLKSCHGMLMPCLQRS